MSVRVATLALSFLAVSLAGCGSAELHIQSGGAPSSYIETFDGKPTSPELGAMRLRKDVCQGLDTTPVGRPLDADDFVAFARSQKLDARLVRARSDLVFVDVVNAGTAKPVRLRVAIVDNPGAAGRELHEALLQHGEGAWGLHRSNLAVLAPNASLDEIIVMSSKLHLACWGVLMVAGHDDTYVVPGGYTEL